MPSLRGEGRGSKKRYAGLAKGKVVLRGLEAVRTDWTPLARDAQRELIRRVFTDEPWEGWLLELRAQLLAGALDDQLVYRKRLRRELDAYDASAPHVRAAQLLADADDTDDTPMTEVRYVITTRGPQPLSQRNAPIDVKHYLDRQLAPALDVVLHQLGTSWQRIAGEQLELL